MQNVLNKILGNAFNNLLKGPYSMIKWDLSQGCKVFSISASLWHINKLKNKHHMIILIHAAKAIDKVQHLFKKKTFHKVGIERTSLNIKAI